MKPVVAIDGPAGVGKSTASRLAARMLGLPHIDTGAMYRAIALKGRRAGLSDDDEEALARIAAESRIEFRREGDEVRTLLDGEDVSDEIRSSEISMASSNVSRIPAVRRVLVSLQQQMGRETGGVLEGRDIGTKVFPDTPYKFYLSARPDVRARRRWSELAAKGSSMSLEEVLGDLVTRDHQDMTRADSPLSHDESYTVLDTSELTIEQVVDAIVQTVESGVSKLS